MGITRRSDGCAARADSAHSRRNIIGGYGSCLASQKMSVFVIATTRNGNKAEALRAIGADDVIVDEGRISDVVKRLTPAGVDGVLELIGTATLLDSLRASKPGGIVCNTGILGNEWVLERFEPLEDIPSTVRFTVYHSGTTSWERSTAALQEIVDGVSVGQYPSNIQRRFRFDEIIEAHKFMEQNRGSGKLVVVVPDGIAGSADA
jgi:NADPH:quinone reductase